MSDVAPLGPAGMPLPDVVNELLCPDAPHGSFDFLQGTWVGDREARHGDARPVTVSAGKSLDGCSIVSVIESGGVRTLTTLAYSDFFELWFLFHLDDQPGTKHNYFVSPDAGEEATFIEARALAIEDEFSQFISQAKLASLEPLRRRVWETANDTEVIWREDVRQSATDSWQVSHRTRLRRTR